MTAMAEPLVGVLFQGVDKASAGYKLLASMGWREGEGLGAQKQGIREHVKVKKKHDAMGVGAAENVTTTRDWTTGMVSFDRILANLKEVTAAQPAKAAAEETSSDEDGGGKRVTAKASKKEAKKGSKGSKRKRAVQPPSSSSDSDSDAGPSGRPPSNGRSAAAAAAAAAAPAAKRLKAASHIGRYSKRERGKLAKNYSAADLEAILGGVSGKDGSTAAAEDEYEYSKGWAGSRAGALTGLPDGMGFTMPAVAEVRAARADSSGSGSEEEEEEQGPGSGSGGGGGAGARKGSEGGKASSQPVAGPAKKARSSQPKRPEAPPPAEQWEEGKRPWWAGMFARAGRMGSIRQELRSGHHASGKAKITVTGFREEDQENLYEQAQDQATHGRQGLGRSDMPKKVAGARWCGTKTKLDDDGEEEEQEAGEEASGSGSGSESEEEGRIVVVQSKKEQAALAGQPPTQAAQQQEQQPPAPGKQAKAKKPKRSSQQDGAAGAAEPETAAGGTAAAAAPPSPVQAGGTAKQPKWRKLVRQLLVDAPERRLKLKQLRKQLAASHGLGAGSSGGDGKESAMAAVLEHLRGCRKFRVCDKFVALAGAR